MIISHSESWRKVDDDDEGAEGDEGVDDGMPSDVGGTCARGSRVGWVVARSEVRASAGRGRDRHTTSARHVRKPPRAKR